MISKPVALSILLLIIVALTIFSYIHNKTSISTVYLKGQQNHQELQVHQAAVCTPIKEDEILVLIWVWPWGDHFPLDRCQTEFNITGCKLTADRSLYDVADALVMHHADIMYDRNSLPQKPRPHFQHWVWFNLEPPMIIRNLHWLDGLFNMSMTFRKDSDIFSPYGQIVASKEPRNFTIPAKSKLVAWVVSKYYDGVLRTKYYEDLKKYIPIDVYGRGHFALENKDFHKTISQYKFYLAFENSVYKDYITEKLWSNSFGSWAVPVVLGTSRENYERFVPKEAFIHVNDFASPKELADYILKLDKDDEKYRSYFNWRHNLNWAGFGGWQWRYCQVCSALKDGHHYRVIHSIEKWFLGNESL